MIIRHSTKEDLPQIIALLKESIGEALTPKTEAYFLWKHEKNPFGRSIVLVAEESGKVIGLRAFMRWRWVSETETITATRAVDTATDPAFQGKGIFKTLTLQVVNDCKQMGLGMVFNSPNPVSMQGYLKMGWTIAGRLPLYLRPGSLFPRFYDANIVNKCYEDNAVTGALQTVNVDWALSKNARVLHTPIDVSYLKWRYAECPVAKYGAVIEAGKFGFVFRIKKMNRFMELRICEVWTEEGKSNGRAATMALLRLVKQLRPALVSCAASPLFESGNKLISNFFGPFKKGPVITIRPLAKDNLDNFEQFSHWQPSLGSMELF